MTELQDTADHLVVVGRGKVIADTTVASLLAAASGNRVTLRTSARPQAKAALENAGATVVASGQDVLTISGLAAERVVALRRAREPQLGARTCAGRQRQQVPGLTDWAKAGIIIKQSTRQGYGYAAMMVTGSNGVRMQYNFTGDTAGMPGAVTAAHPRWLRLARSGNTITGHDSADGTHWTQVGTVRLTGLPSTVKAGMFATSPNYTVTQNSFGGASDNSGPGQATGVFDHVSLAGTAPGTWTGTTVGGGGPAGGPGPGGGPGSAPFTRNGGTFTVTGSGDIAPVTPGPDAGLPTVTIGRGSRK